jgi:hypothetical protein
VSVTEQNSAARRFYEACGLVVETRSDFDDAGRPFRLLRIQLVETMDGSTEHGATGDCSGRQPLPRPIMIEANDLGIVQEAM